MREPCQLDLHSTCYLLHKSCPKNSVLAVYCLYSLFQPTFCNSLLRKFRRPNLPTPGAEIDAFNMLGSVKNFHRSLEVAMLVVLELLYRLALTVNYDSFYDSIVYQGGKYSCR